MGMKWRQIFKQKMMANVVFGDSRRFFLASHTRKLWLDCGIIKNNDNCDLGIT